ncbi:DltD domain-containing protein [Xylariales sp. AK1849]|nr:DltD domain-containing protein [Xylariales sp. AK1849]
MAPLRSQQTVYCKTIDGISLEAWYWEVGGPAPVIVMSHGTAEGFQSAGYNVLLYDTRNVGGSGDVVSYAGSLPSVDAKRIIVWGVSLGASVSACCTAIDRRPIAVLMVCPIFKMIRPDRRKAVFAQLMRDRQSQLRGNEPFTLPPYDSKGENPAGYAGSGGPGGTEAHMLMKMATNHGHRNFRDRVTLQTFYKLALFRPRDLLEEFLETPTMMIIPENDYLSLPEDQLAAYEAFKAPKQVYWANGAGHMNVLTGPGHQDVMKATLQFFESVLENDIV